MINIARKEDCVGCGACVDVCPISAIRFSVDKEGFWYPVVNHSVCVDCKLCEKVCPIINADLLIQTNNGFEPKVYSSYHKNDETRFISTSGGIFSALAEGMFERNGIVCGAVWNPDFSVTHIVTNSADELPKIRGSKYIQSNSVGIFKEIKDRLSKGNQVLACGTPCQMAALRKYVGRECENLIIVDFICSNINSPLIFRKYIENLEAKYKSSVVMYHPKNKEYGGWHKFSFKAVFADGSIYVKQRLDDDFTHCFIGTHVASRPCCFECKFKSIPRVSDITIADFWGIENINPSMDGTNGTSLVIINNRKGESFFNSITDKIVYSEQLLSDAIKYNQNLVTQIPHLTISKTKFYDLLNNKGFSAAMRYSRNKTKPSLFFTTILRIKNFLCKI